MNRISSASACMLTILFSGCTDTQKREIMVTPISPKTNSAERQFKLAPLPYAYNALEPYLDARTMEIHYTKHHQGYVDKLNQVLEKYPELYDKSIEYLLTHLQELPETIRTGVRNFGGGYYNHTLYWNNMTSQRNGKPTGALAKKIDATFGSFEKFKEEFNKQAATLFGSGWTWLIKKPDGSLAIVNTQNQDCPLSDGNIPLLVIDIWEHAYYLKYQNRRPDFIDSWWHVVDWNEVEKRYAMTT